MAKFQVIQGTPALDTPTELVRRRLRVKHRVAEMLQCPRCGCRELVESRTGMLSGAHKSATPTLLCVGCLTKGERVVVE